MYLDGISNVQPLASINNDNVQKNSSSEYDSSSIMEKSKSVKIELIPLMNFPILSPPAEQEISWAVTLGDGTRQVLTTDALQTFLLQEGNINKETVQAWMTNLREIAEYVQQLLASPMYQQIQEAFRNGDANETISGVEGVAAANAAANKQKVDLLSTLSHWQALEHISPTATVEDTSNPPDPSRALMIPLAAALLAGGLTIATETLQPTNLLGGATELVQQVQALFPSVTMQDLVPLINLMVAAPIYFNSWNEAISNIKSRERQNHMPAIQNFAKDIIKIVSDPNFINNTLIQQMKGTKDLIPSEQERLSHVLKFVLLGVALGLLYSAETGKVQNGQFGGTESQELGDLLMGKISNLDDPLKNNLITLARQQLQALSIEDRKIAAEMLLSYAAKSQDLDPMLKPANIIKDAFENVDRNENMGVIKV